MSSRLFSLVLSFALPGLFLPVLAQQGTEASPTEISVEGPNFPEQVLALMKRGDYDAAEAQLQNQQDPYSLRLGIELAKRKGQSERVQTLASRLLGMLQNGSLDSPPEIAQAAYAAWQLERWHDANQAYIEASKLPGVPSDLYIDWGHLYLEKYNAAEAQSIFGDALKAPQGSSGQSRWERSDALLGLARTMIEQGLPESEAALQQAEEANPDNLDLLVFKTLRAIREADWEEAKGLLDKGLEVNPNYVPLLQCAAAYHYFRNEDKDYEKFRKQVHQINPSNGSLYEMLGDLCIPRRRLEEGIQFYRRAVELNPRLWSAVASLGINLLRMGEETEGQDFLEEAYAADPFNIWTVNTLRLLDSFENFERFETTHFQVKIEKDEVTALRPYVEDLLERSIDTISNKYDHRVEGKYIFEMYSNHADFAVRTLGLPGLGALGATFGRVVAMDSPAARPEGKFHWGSTLWHEVAHVVTLSLSNQKVPRWLTEGISMMEERLGGPGWGDFLSRSFVKAYEEGKLLPLKDLNAGFERPRFPGQLELSYFQAGWVCEFLAERHGLHKIRELLVAFGRDESLEEAFQKALGMSVEEVDEDFQEELKRVLDPLVERLEEPKEMEEVPEELKLATMKKLLEDKPNNFVLNMRVAAALIDQDQKSEAVPYLEKALEVFPYSTGPTSPYDFLAQYYEEQGDRDQTIEILRRHWSLAPNLSSVGMKLAGLLLEQGEQDEALEIYEQLMFVDPLEAEPHHKLGNLYLENGRYSEAIREFEVLLSMKAPDPAGVHYGMARALAAKEQRQEARRHVLMALEIAPSFEEAQKLLLRLVRQ